MEFPVFVYRDGGDHQRPGGTFSYAVAHTPEDVKSLCAEGGYLNLQDLIDGKKPDSHEVPDESAEEALDESPPTREEIEAKAEELGIKFRKNIKDENLLKKIEEKLNELD